MPSNKEKFNKKYGFPKDAGHSKAEISRLSGVPRKYLDKIWDRAAGARKSNPESVRRASDGKKIGGKSLRGKMSANAWGYGRIYSFLMKNKSTWGGSDKDIADEVKKLKIKGYTR